MKKWTKLSLVLGLLFITLTSSTIGSETTTAALPFWGKTDCFTYLVGAVSDGGCQEMTLCEHSYYFWIDFGSSVSFEDVPCP